MLFCSFLQPILRTICLMVLVNSFIRTPHRSTSQILAVLTLVIATATAVPLFNHDVEILFNGQFIIDPLAIGLKISAYVAVLLVVLSTTINEKINQSEILLIELFATLGISIICSAANLLTIYLGLETLALSLYGLVAANKNSIEREIAERQLHCRQRAPIENVWSTSGIF